MPEQYFNNFSTTIGVGGYTSGAGVLNVIATAGITLNAGDTCHLLVYRVIAGAATAIVNFTATAVNSSTQFAVTAEGSDANALAGDNVVCILSIGGMDQIRKDLMQFGSYGSLPSTTGQKQGNQYSCTDSPYKFIYNGTIWQAYHGEYGAVVPPSSVGTSWVNQGSATLTQAGGVDYIAQAAGNSSAHNWALRYIVIPAPSSPYTITAAIRVLSSQRVTSGNNRAGIAIRDSVGSKFIIIDLHWASSTEATIDVTNWTNPTTYGGTTYATLNWSGVSGGTAGFPFDIVLRVVTDSTNTTYYASGDGVIFVQVFQHAKNTFVTPTGVAYGISNYSQPVDMFVRNFNLTQP